MEIEKLMKTLDITREEALDIIEQDKAINKGKPTYFDLDKETEKQAKKYANVTTKKPTVYKWTTRKRKENPEKRKIINNLFDFLDKISNLYCENVQITNAERQISFKIGENDYELTLVCKRKPKK